MGLINSAGPDWAYCTHNFPSTPSMLAPGATCTPGTSDSDGTAVDLFGSALTHDVEYLKLGFTYAQPTSGNNDVLATILIDPAGGTSWATLIPFLICGATCTTTNVSDTTPGGIFPCWYDFPLWIPSGATIGVQARTAHTSAGTLSVTAIAHGGNANPASWWCGQRVTGIGITEASSTGTAHTAGNSGSFSTWTNIGSTLPADCGALQWGVNGEGDSFYTNDRTYQFEFGVGSVRIGPPILKAINGNEAGSSSIVGPVFKQLASGTQLMVRGTCSGSAVSLGVGAYAVH